MESEDQNVDLSIRRLRAWIYKSATILNGLSAPRNQRNLLSSALFHLALEHQDAICTLAENRLYGSSLALFRPLTDAFYRGAWLLLAANELELDGFATGKEPPKTSKIKEILGDRIEGLQATNVDLNRAFGSLPHDFTHGGLEQVLARIDGDTIVQDYFPSNMVMVHHWTSQFGRFASTYMAWMANEDALVHALFHSYSAIYSPGNLATES